jgi:RNA recognition motif-containing protein
MGRRAPDPNARAFVANVAYSATGEELRAHLTEMGAHPTQVRIAQDHAGQSRGFAFADFASQGERDAAIRLCAGSEFQGRPLVVRPAEPRPSSHGWA